MLKNLYLNTTKNPITLVIGACGFDSLEAAQQGVKLAPAHLTHIGCTDNEYLLEVSELNLVVRSEANNTPENIEAVNKETYDALTAVSEKLAAAGTAHSFMD